MISYLDIYRSAQVLVKHHGEDAPIQAAMRADAMLEKGDLEGYAAWRRILRAAEELQRAETGRKGPKKPGKLSLHPLSLEQALKGAMETGVPPESPRKKKLKTRPTTKQAHPKAQEPNNG